MVNHGGLPCARLNGRTLRINRDDLDAYMRKHLGDAEGDAVDKIVAEMLEK